MADCTALCFIQSASRDPRLSWRRLWDSEEYLVLLALLLTLALGRLGADHPPRSPSRGRPKALKVGRAEKQGHDEEKLARREEAVQRLLNATVERYAAALELYDAWRAQGVRDATTLDAALADKSDNERLAELRRQIEMRTVGLGWTEFETKWGFLSDEKRQKEADLRRVLIDDILPHERTQRRLKKLPAAAVPPQLKPRALKVLGTEDKDALHLEAQDLFNISSLLPKAEAARARREAAGISDRVEVVQQLEAPPFDTNLVGKWLARFAGPTKREARLSRFGRRGL